jgi:hypothetical protein
VFIRSSAVWKQQAYVKASNSGADDNFGGALALAADGNTLAVGAWGEDSGSSGVGGVQSDNSASNSGAVYVLVRSGSSWTQQAYVKSSNTDAYDGFGKSVALAGDGNTLAIGASAEDSGSAGVNGSQDDNSSANCGAAYLFARSGTSWTQQAYIKAPNAGQADSFGDSVALSGDGNALAVGASWEDSSSIAVGGAQDDEGAQASGAVYIFRRSAEAWSPIAYVKASNPGASDHFGNALALSSDASVIAVSSYYEGSGDGTPNDNSASWSGAAYVYR